MKVRCALSNELFQISDREIEYCRRFKLPLPTISPRERLRNMLVFRNRCYLYNSRCAVTGQPMLSCFPPERSFNTCDAEAWCSDAVDNKDFGREYDFSRPFFEQFYELYRSAYLPGLAVNRPTMENSDFTNGITGAKNCYLLFSSSFNEDCLFSHSLWRCRNVVDSVYLHDCELCYGCEDLFNCYKLRWARHCRNCSDSAFLYNCQGCSNCYLSANLNHQQYYFLNEPLTAEEYAARMAEIDLGSAAVVAAEERRFAELIKSRPIKQFFGINNQSSSGDYISHNKNCQRCYFVSSSEDVVDSLWLDRSKDCFVYAMYGNDAELIYNSVTVGDSAYDLRFCIECWQSVSQLEYCAFCCYSVNNCFGCVGLRQASYCVLNRQYDKNEYSALTARIKRQMLEQGEYAKFFPPAFSPFYYNESDANAYFPLARPDAEAWGFRWREDEPAQPDRPAPAVPENVRDAGDDSLTQIFSCSETGKPYRLIKPELHFYRRLGVPPPAVAPMRRIQKRLAFFELKPVAITACAKCSKPIETVQPTGERAIYCEECFRNEVY